MNIGLLSTLVVASVLSLGAFGCAASSEGGDTTAGAAAAATQAEAKTIAATSEPRFESLGGVWGVHGVDNPAGMDLKVIELGAGDLEINGAHLFLSAYGPDHGDGGVFDLGLSVNQLTSATMDGTNQVKLVGTQDAIDPTTNDFENVPFEATIELTLVGSDIQPTVSVAAQGNGPEPVTKTVEERYQVFDSLFAVQDTNSKAGNIVRLFETGGGDPAMNGDHLLVNIMSYPEGKTYDLDLDVNTVTKLEATDSTVVIGGSEDVMGDDGNIGSRPFEYTITYAIGQDGAPAPSIALTRTR